MGEVLKEIFEGLVYHQGASIREERVKASNLCARILIFGSFFLLSFVNFFFLPLFRFFDLTFYYLFSFLFDFFIALCFPLIFHSCFLLFFAHVVSSLANPNLLENKRLVVVVVTMTQFMKEVILWFSSIFLGTCIVLSNDCTTYHYVCTILLCFD
jgi:hypothetical protein